MTNEQREKLRKIIDLNWDTSHETNPLKKYEMSKELNCLKKDLRNDMGHDEYDRFMDAGGKMFAPKSN
jgi:hypothetical protein